MPVMGGEEALRRIQEIRPGTAIVLSSGFSETQAVAKLGDRQARGFLQKPYTATALARKLKQAIQSARAIG
jgi:DNA-binding NarL/FixJ family response regulator